MIGSAALCIVIAVNRAVRHSSSAADLRFAISDWGVVWFVSYKRQAPKGECPLFESLPNRAPKLTLESRAHLIQHVTAPATVYQQKGPVKVEIMEASHAIGLNMSRSAAGCGVAWSWPSQCSKVAAKIRDVDATRTTGDKGNTVENIMPSP